MSSFYGNKIRLSIFGQSHSEYIGMTLDGIPAGKKLDIEKLESFLIRRAPGKSRFSSSRKEPDKPEFICGIREGVFVGAPVTALIKNTDIKPSDYLALKNTPRPGHADYTAGIKYHGFNDYSGGGHLSGRLTAALCTAGGICLQLLEQEGITIRARIKTIGSFCDDSEFAKSVSDKEFPVSNDFVASQMLRYIEEKQNEGDSVGGTVECVIDGIPAGVGDPIFDGMENRISSAIFSIPAIKGIEFGNGFAGTCLTGSENNDEFFENEGGIYTATNHCGGILGGITNGMPVNFRVAVKPTPSISKSQSTINLVTHKAETISVSGRHDACIVPRVVPCIEAAAAIAVYDAII